MCVSLIFEFPPNRGNDADPADFAPPPSTSNGPFNNNNNFNGGFSSNNSVNGFRPPPSQQSQRFQDQQPQPQELARYTPVPPPPLPEAPRRTLSLRVAEDDDPSMRQVCVSIHEHETFLNHLFPQSPLFFSFLRRR